MYNRSCSRCCTLFFFFNDTATTEIYTLSLHDALPILRTSSGWRSCTSCAGAWGGVTAAPTAICSCPTSRSEEHTSELQSQSNLVCRLLLEKKKKTYLVCLWRSPAQSCVVTPVILICTD